MLDMQDRRNGGRRAFATELIFETTALKHAHTVKSIGTDIGEAGIGLKSDRSVEPGEVVKISIPIKELGIMLPVFAQVVWTRKRSNKYELGMRFL